MSQTTQHKLLTATDSVIHFDRSQRAVFDDPSSVIAVNFHRQKGKDFVAAGKAIDDGCETGQNWWIVGMTQAQADETFLKVKQICSAMRKIMERMFGSSAVEEEGERYIDYDYEIKHAFECTSRVMRLPNGARITSLPGKNPDVLAGRTGNMILTEFGLYPNGGRDHWDVLFPITTRGGFRFIMISTPRGKNTKFYEVCSNPDGLYSVHTCDIYKSVYEEGYQLYDTQRRPFPMRTREEQEAAIAAYRKIYNSEAKWPREYECKFTGDLSALIPWAQLERAAGLGADLPFDCIDVVNEGQPLGDLWDAFKAYARGGGRVEVGWDVARTTHISALPVNFARLNQPKHLRFLVCMKNLSFDSQRAFVRKAMDLQRFSVGAGDATGLGKESNETLEKLYACGKGESRWTPFTFTGPGKRSIASALSTAFSDGTQTLPPMDGPYKFVATDIYAIQKDDTGANIELEETENPLRKDSHCDIGYALGLSRVAGASNVTIPLPPSKRNKPAGW